MDPRERNRHVSESLVGRKIQEVSQGWYRDEQRELKELRGRERIQALPRNYREQQPLADLVPYRAAFYSGLADGCVAVMVVDTAQRIASSCHYETLTSVEIDRLLSDPRQSQAEKLALVGRMATTYDKDAAAQIVPQSARKDILLEAVLDCVRGYYHVLNPNLSRDAGVLVAGISYASSDEAQDLVACVRGHLQPIGLPLIATHLGHRDGIYASLNHAKLQGFGFYNSKTRQQEIVGHF